MSQNIPSVILGFPRIGENRELKVTLESYWAKKVDENTLEESASKLRQTHWGIQSNIALASSNDFSFYDGMLDMIELLGAIPERFADIANPRARYFAMARGDENHTALSMLKWFNTNYHYLVPELGEGMVFAPDTTKLKALYKESLAHRRVPKIQLVGPLTFLALSDRGYEANRGLLNALLVAYGEVLKTVASWGSELYVQFDEPILALDPSPERLQDAKKSYDYLAPTPGIKPFVATYFAASTEATEVLLQTPLWGIALDFVHGEENLASLPSIAKSDKVLIAGVIDGRNVWACDLGERLEFLNQLATKLPRERIYPSTSCSLLHLPYSVAPEAKIPLEVKPWLAFAKEKVKELEILSKRFAGVKLGAEEMEWERLNLENAQKRRDSKLTQNRGDHSTAKIALQEAKPRTTPFKERIALQERRFKLPPLPTTTIGSFPQDKEVRALRLAYKKGEITQDIYEEGMRAHIKACVEFQEEVGFDVLVHGEFERTDMVEYFGELLEGALITQNGWVQSYGSRCVKPPVIYGDVSRPKEMTLSWSRYAQSLTSRLMKGMLTGPVTILNWSFVRDDIPRSEVCAQIALAIKEEIRDLEEAGIAIIQVDEAAFKEGYPLKKAQRAAYEEFALKSFWIATSSVKDETQIHTHMCYSVFDDIITTILAMDADVITIETARAGNRLLEAFKKVNYDKQIGPGIYDIHSPRIPSVEEMKRQILALFEVIDPKQIWVNPDCGLKTRGWSETKASLQNLIQATQEVRAGL